MIKLKRCGSKRTVNEVVTGETKEGFINFDYLGIC
jgi:hypothetical protein